MLLDSDVVVGLEELKILKILYISDWYLDFPSWNFGFSPLEWNCQIHSTEYQKKNDLNFKLKSCHRNAMHINGTLIQTFLFTEVCKIIQACSNFCSTMAANWLLSATACQSAIFGKIGKKTINLAGIILHLSVCYVD